MIERRGFLATMLALGAAPALVRAESLMKIPESRIWTPYEPYVYAYHWGVDGNPYYEYEGVFLIHRDTGHVLNPHQFDTMQAQKARRHVESANRAAFVETRRQRLAELAMKPRRAGQLEHINTELRR